MQFLAARIHLEGVSPVPLLRVESTRDQLGIFYGLFSGTLALRPWTPRE